jgi:integrase
MKTGKRQKAPGSLWESTATQCLVRNTSSGTYYARFRAAGKLRWRSLETDSYTIAKTKLPGVIEDERKLVAAGDGSITLEQAIQGYLDRDGANPKHKPRTVAYHRECVESLKRNWPTPQGVKVRRITKDDCLTWARKHAAAFSATKYNHTLGILRKVIEIGIEQGARHDNPARVVERLSERPKQLHLPEPDQFKAFIAEIEGSGSGFSQPCADFVRFLAFGGFRLGEARAITWADVDFKRGEIVVRGDPEHGLKGRQVGEVRRVPMIPDMRALLERVKGDTAPDSKARVMRVGEAQKAMDRAAKVIGMHRLTHHDLRHLFATRCIESGVDIPTVARWLGHKDGGALAMRVYGHLRDQHSTAMAQRVTFDAPEEPENILPMNQAEAV